jgi:hypothetical protein
MQKKILGVFLVLLVLIGSGVVVLSVQAASSLTAKDIESKAVAQAQLMGLHGTPTSVKSKLTTIGDFNKRLDPQVAPPPDPNAPMWLVVIKGTVDFNGAAAIPPAPDGSTSVPTYPAMWELLEPNGHVMAWGGLLHDTDINLDGPPVEVYPDPPQDTSNSKK